MIDAVHQAQCVAFIEIYLNILRMSFILGLLFHLKKFYYLMVMINGSWTDKKVDSKSFSELFDTKFVS